MSPALRGLSYPNSSFYTLFIQSLNYLPKMWSHYTAAPTITIKITSFSVSLLFEEES